MDRSSRGKTASHPVSFEDAAKRAGVTARIPLGVRPIRVKRIVGSAGKAEKLGPDFLPLGAGPASANYQNILNIMKTGEVLPPITLYQLGNRYFVIDGHTRVAAARALGIEFLDAEVIEALPKKEGEANLTYFAHREFQRYTGLEGIRLTAPWRYHLLHHHIEGYRLYLERSRDKEVTLPEAAAIWYRTQYAPTVLEIRRRNLKSSSGGRTAGDVYTDILRAWSAEEGLGVSLREMLDRYDQEVRATHGPLKRARRAVSDAVDAALPAGISPINRPPSQGKFEAEDVEAELEGLGDEEG